ncbi:two-component system, OmpR family, osmolarity sensor histidine kinase EnvZ [Afifella marina DSM 2698]|uniref:histidine kinase n=1 Tax=Afifella marina DSM 2698 TaxID=1120955 RepID=A0A1G5P393_AFIMA|nr:two-component system, OmpR family, osmolarity sensor histidine kinase EnvZ [Afifella marina DSM 2698]
MSRAPFLRRAVSAVFPDRGTPARLNRQGLRRSLRRWRRRLKRIRPFGGLGDRLMGRMPKGLFARSILIVVTPIVILQAIVAYVFMERHWQLVTERLSQSLTGDIAALIAVIERYPHEPGYLDVTRLAADTFQLTVSILPPDPLPPPVPKPFFSLLDHTLSEQITQVIGRPFWIDTVGNSDLVEIRIRLDDVVLRVFAPRRRAYASNSHIFLVWMSGSALILLAIALLFLRNQIKPIVALAYAAESFGKGRNVENFKPRGAREVRQASQAFLDMRERIERQIEQRTTMLSGVSHDLRTILTRFRLELALLPEGEESQAMQNDVEEMSRMLEDYLAFAKGDAGEETEAVVLPDLLETLADHARRSGDAVVLNFSGEPEIHVRPTALARCISNLLTNAAKFADRVEISATHRDGILEITIDDDGPGIPDEDKEAVFRPFYRLDDARNVDVGGTGLGLAIARDIARSHGGDIALEDSRLGGLRAVVTIPA